MKRSGLAWFIGALCLATACGDDSSSATNGESSTGDDGAEETSDSSPSTSLTTTLTSGADTSDGESTIDPSGPADSSSTDDGGSSSDSVGESSTGDLCGNDVVDDGEVCDGTALGDADCISAGFDGGTLTCWASCDAYDTTQCTMADCGNGIVEQGELCDGADLGGADCVTQGFDGGTLGCSPSCQAFNMSGCSECGDGDVDGDEPCDGNDLGALTCATQGFQAGTLACADDCTIVTDGCNDNPPCSEQDIGSVLGNAVATGSTVGEDDDLAQACAGGGGVEHLMTWVAPGDGTYRFDTSGSGFDTSLALYTDCESDEFACNDNISANEPDSRIVADLAAGDIVLVSVSGNGSATGSWVLNINLDGPGGTCCAPHGSYGCDSDPSCEDTVCAVDASCCDSDESWDAACVAVAAANCAPCIGVCGNGAVDDVDELCDGANLDGETCVTQGFSFGSLGCLPDCTFDTASCGSYDGSCCEAHVFPDPGCADGACVEIVCGNDPYCCATSWDGLCSGAAQTNCAVCNEPMCGNDLIDVDGEVCDGTELVGEDCITQGFTGGTLACADDCSGYDTSACFNPMCGNNVIDVDGEVCDGTELVGEDCITQGFIGGTLGCVDDCTGYDTSGCFDDGEDCCFAWGGAGCSDATCNDAVCGADGFCCSSTWDSICANEAAGVCTVCGGGEGDCCTETGDVGCVDNICVELICGFGGLDSTCCSASWTAGCTALATANCDVCM